MPSALFAPVSCLQFPEHAILFVSAIPLHTCPLILQCCLFSYCQLLGTLLAFVDSTHILTFLKFIPLFPHSCIHSAFIYKPIGK